MFSSISLSEFSLEFSLISYGTDAWSIRKVHKLMCHMLNLAAVSLTDETKHCVVFEHLERWFCPESDHELYFTDKIIVSLKKKKVNLNVILRKQCWSSKGNNFNFDFFWGGGGWRETLVEGRPMKMCFASVFKPNSASEEIFCCLLRSISSGVSQFTDKNWISLPAVMETVIVNNGLHYYYFFILISIR